jgi:hypothetical protein
MRQAIEEEKELRNNIEETLQERNHLERHVDTLRCQCTDLESLVGVLKRKCGALKVEAENATIGPSDDRCGPGVSKLCYVETNSTVHLPGCSSLNCAVNPICELRPCLVCIGRHGKHVVATKSNSSARSSNRHGDPRTNFKPRVVIAA